MKKGFTMIELIFVIVILGILASVAIPRLAGTREDAEISAAVANLRTLLGDAASHYVLKGTFTGSTWSEITSVPLKKTDGNAMDATTAALGTGAAPTATANLKVGDADNCIGFHLVNKNGNTPAYIKFTKRANGTTADVCQRVLASKPVAAYVDSVVKNGADTIQNAMAIGSSTSIYPTN
nr:prepilin-type N-terminal cleavage/methylation domain-containing protein [uncultured Campylobacter sp.]